MYFLSDLNYDLKILNFIGNKAGIVHCKASQMPWERSIAKRDD